MDEKWLIDTCENDSIHKKKKWQSLSEFITAEFTGIDGVHESLYPLNFLPYHLPKFIPMKFDFD